jgi:hypothetical protein
MVNNITNINKTNKVSLNSDGKKFHQYQQNKQSFLVCFVNIGEITDHRCLNFPCFVDIGEIVDHHCLGMSFGHV